MTLEDERWAAANELIRAADDLRLLAEVGRSRVEDAWRLEAADERWSELQGRRRLARAGRRPIGTLETTVGGRL